jgi:hypothetical protein
MNVYLFVENSEIRKGVFQFISNLVSSDLEFCFYLEN